MTQGISFKNPLPVYFLMQKSENDIALCSMRNLKSKMQFLAIKNNRLNFLLSCNKMNSAKFLLNYIYVFT